MDEFNGMLEGKISGSSASVEQDRFITVSVHKKNVDEARTFFSRVTGEVSSKLSRLNSSSNELDAAERLDVLRGFFRPDESSLPFDLQSAMKRGHNLKDTICPDSLEFHRDHFKMGNQYGRVLFLKDYASYIKDSMILELTDLNRRMMLSIDMIPVPTDEAVREVENKLLGVETNVTNWQRRQNSNQNFSAVVPYDLEQQRKETREMLDDLTTRDQRMLFAVVTLVHLADSKEELDSDTETLQSIARKHLCQLAKLSFQQQDGLITALPLGLRRIDALRTLTTEALAVLMPFKAQEIRHRHGIYYGQNAISKNLILADRKELLNGNGFMLVSIPPKYSVSQIMGYLKGKSSLMIYEKYANLKYKYGNRHFWCRGYYVSTVGRNRRAIEEYIRNQLQEDYTDDQLSIKEFVDPFTGEPVRGGK
ncbi:VirB4-like conjugal transfer ATPase, CD1110 family [Hominenteromicrobium sp.]|uniref:VirB4-like conjugal transfer ATPase, CD1110 family n=1 Tax=Hominenteromicrobium sp. TaxID=3073581 RepID=UPI003AB2DB58